MLSKVWKSNHVEDSTILQIFVGTNTLTRKDILMWSATSQSLIVFKSDIPKLNKHRLFQDDGQLV